MPERLFLKRRILAAGRKQPSSFEFTTPEYRGTHIGAAESLVLCRGLLPGYPLLELAFFSWWEVLRRGCFESRRLLASRPPWPFFKFRLKYTQAVNEMSRKNK